MKSLKKSKMSLNFIPVATVDEVLEHALTKPLQPIQEPPLAELLKEENKKTTRKRTTKKKEEEKE